ncbi:hypothetical protein WJX73_008826 [Symbiochloris irregularis]|uniref:Vacuolar import/degradation Vid27 C-terminal domain-containing protein n=1 Tax=Symbiochloris irregularis TaxID=706552 RepID=A0AAW1PLW3_9CHLO
MPPGAVQDQRPVHHQLCVGAGGRSWVVRGDEVVTLENSDSGFKEVMGHGFTFRLLPSFAMQKERVGITTALLMKHESQLLALVSDVSNCIIQADIATGKVVRIWTPKKSAESVNLEWRTMATDTPAAQLDNRDTFVCLGSDSVSRWDLRAPPGLAQKLSNTGFRKYAPSSKPQFSCMATAGDGSMVIGSASGIVHMYAPEPLRQWSIANTEFSAGAPVTDLDITYDGHWVLATTDHYLVIAPTQFRTPSGRRNGFQYTVQMHMEASAVRLVLGNTDAVTVHGAVNEHVRPFRGGRFDWVTDSESKERRLAASCGEFVASWSWRRIKLAMKEGARRIPNHQLVQQSIGAAEVSDAAFMHQAFSPTRGGSQMGVLTPRSIFNVSFPDD